jgi:putative transposase
VPIKPNFNPDYQYFVTTNAYNHAHLFESDEIKCIIADSFSFMRADGWLKLYAFVVMPNHIHFIARILEGHILSDVMRDFKKFTSKKIAQQLQAQENPKVLEVLREAGETRGHQFKVWDDEYDARDVFSPKFFEQKMNYIHYNPCQPQWNLVKYPEDYLWSSARFYMANEPAVIPIDDARELY